MDGQTLIYLMIGLVGVAGAYPFMDRQRFWMLAISLVALACYISVFINIMNEQIAWAIGSLILSIVFSLALFAAADFRRIKAQLFSQQSDAITDYLPKDDC